MAIIQLDSDNMGTKEKQLLLVDLCARLPYGVKCEFNDGNIKFNGGNIKMVEELKVGGLEAFIHGVISVKPYLRPLSSMTEEEKRELNNYIFSEKGLRYFWFDEGIVYNGPDNQCFIGLGNDTIDKMVDWLNKKMFDYRGLIEKGIALEAPKDMYIKDNEQW